MALYLGGQKSKIISENILYCLNYFSPATPITTNGVRLLTSDNYILKDSDGLYITAKEEE